MSLYNMDPQYTNSSEEQLRDKMLRHQFVPEPQDWQLMEALLDARDHAPAPMPAGVLLDQPAQRKVFFKLRQRGWILSLTSTILFLTLTTFHLATPATEKSDKAVTSIQETTTQPAAMALPTAHNAVHIDIPSPKETIDLPKPTQSLTSSTRWAAKGLSGSNKGRATALREPDNVQQSGTYEEVVQKSQGLKAQQTTMPRAGKSDIEVNKSQDYERGRTVMPRVGKSDEGKTQTTLLPLPILPPKQAPKPISEQPRRMPEMPKAQTPKLQVQKPALRNIQHAVVVGANINMTNYRSRTLSLMPHIGYSLTWQRSPRWGIQTDLVGKVVRGYGFESTLEYKVKNVASNLLDLKGNNLFFVEMPILFKKYNQHHAGRAWYAGLKPALVFPVLSSKENDYQFFNSITADPKISNADAAASVADLGDGIRRFDLGATLGHEWQFGRRSALDLRANAGFFDLSADNFFKNSDYHLNTDVQLSFRYYFR